MLIVRISDQAVRSSGRIHRLSTLHYLTDHSHSPSRSSIHGSTLRHTYTLDGAPRTRRQTQSPRYLGALRPICPFSESSLPPPPDTPGDRRAPPSQANVHASPTHLPTPPTPQPQNAQRQQRVAFSQAKMHCPAGLASPCTHALETPARPR